MQRLIQAVNPQHGRVLIYVWAIEQDELSKRKVTEDDKVDDSGNGKDVMVPWVLSKALGGERQGDQEVFNRYYHMFAKGELAALVIDAAQIMGLVVEPPATEKGRQGVEIVQDDWERSNYYVELRRWSS